MSRLQTALEAAGCGDWIADRVDCGFELWLDEAGAWVAVNAKLAAWGTQHLGPGYVRLR